MKAFITALLLLAAAPSQASIACWEHSMNARSIAVFRVLGYSLQENVKKHHWIPRDQALDLAAQVYSYKSTPDHVQEVSYSDCLMRKAWASKRA